MNKSLNLQPCTHLQGCFCKQRVDNGTVTFGIMLITGWKNYKFANCNSKLKQFFVDEIATTGTKHMHIFIYSKSPIRFSTLKNRFPVAHIDKANGSVMENRDYLRKEGKWQGSDKEQRNLIDTFEEVGDVPKPVDENSPDMSALIEEIKNGLDTYEIIKLHQKYAFRIKEIDTLRQTVIELLCSCW